MTTMTAVRPTVDGSTMYRVPEAFVGSQGAEEAIQRRRLEFRRRDLGPQQRMLAAYLEERINDLLALPDGWDGHRATAITVAAVENAASLVFRVTDDLHLAPQIFPLPDGGLQLEWHAGGDDIEIEVDGAGGAFALVAGPDGHPSLESELGAAAADALVLIRAAIRRLSARVNGAA